MPRVLWPVLLGLSVVSTPSVPGFDRLPAPLARVAAQEPQPVSSKIWVGRYKEFEEFLSTAEIERTTNVGTGILGIKRAYFKPGGLAESAALRSIRPGRYDGFWESYKGDVAAYRLDRLLELDMVPPTVERRYDGQMVSLQLWASNMKMLKEVQEQKLRPANIEEYNFQQRRQKVFHNLTGNLDPNQGNILYDPVWNTVLIDFSRAFTNTRKLLFEATAIDRPFFDRLKALDRDTLRREIGDLVEGAGVDYVLLRRDDIVRAFERVAKEKGADQVFTP